MERAGCQVMGMEALLGLVDKLSKPSCYFCISFSLFGGVAYDEFLSLSLSFFPSYLSFSLCFFLFVSFLIFMTLSHVILPRLETDIPLEGKKVVLVAMEKYLENSFIQIAACQLFRSLLNYCGPDDMVLINYCICS